MTVTYSYKITPTGRITYLKNDKRVAKAEIPAKTLARLEKEIAGAKPSKKVAKKATKKAPAKKVAKKAPKKRAAKVTFEDDDTIPLPSMMNPSSDDIGDMLIIENYNKCTEKCDWGENACNVDTGRCIKKLKNGGVPKAYNSFKSGNKTIVSKKLSDKELKDKISIALKPKRKTSPKKKASPKKKTVKAPKKKATKRVAKVVIDDKIAENFEKCKETCDWSESVCNVDTGRCVKKLKSGDLSKAYKDYTRVNVDDEIVIISKKSTKRAIENSISIPVKATRKPATKKRAKRCDDVDDYVECADGKICSAATGRCIADSSQNRSGKMQIEVDGRTIVGNANVIAKLAALFSGAKIGPALVTAKPKGRPKGKQAPKDSLEEEKRKAMEIVDIVMKDVWDDMIEEQMTPDRSIGNTNAAIKQLADIKKFNPSKQELAIAADLIKKGKKFLPELKAIQKKKEKLLKKLTDVVEITKKKIQKQTSKANVDLALVEGKSVMNDLADNLFDEFNEIESRRVKEFGSPATMIITHLAAGGELIDMPIRAPSPKEIQIPTRKPPTPPRRTSVEPTPPPRGSERRPSRDRPSKGPMDVMIPGTSPSSRLSAVMGAERPDFEKIVSTAIEDATASARKTPPPLPATASRRRSAEPDIIDKTKLNIEKAFERCLVELDK